MHQVEVDEAYVEGVEAGVAGRNTHNKPIVVIAAEVSGSGTGRIRMACVPGVSGESLVVFGAAAVCQGAVVRTDGWWSYNGIAQLG